jgi:hypothetical protein
VIVGEHDGRGGELLHVAQTLHTRRRRAGFAQGREKNTDQDRDDANDDQKFDEGKRKTARLVEAGRCHFDSVFSWAEALSGFASVFPCSAAEPAEDPACVSEQ